MAKRLAGAGVTARETEVLLAVAARLRNREIAARLHVSVRTVESHVAALRRKLGVNSRSGLAELAAVDRDLVGDTLTRALGVTPPPGPPVAELLREAAGDLQCLLLVDNCEHVIVEAAELLAELLTSGGLLRVLATSREPLGVPGEISYPVPALPVPAPGSAPPDAATAATYDAVRLFVERAAAASPGFTLTDADAPAVTTLCQRLDGLPLVIELAASKVRSFAPAELVAHLDERFELLSGGPRTVAPRHRTLRNAIDWSYRLLDGTERALLDRLGVFPGEFDYSAIQAVAEGTSVMALLPRLVDKSLVSRTGCRYRLLETIRAYASQRLAASGTESVVKRRHAAHYLGVAEQAAGHLRGRDQRAWLDRLTVERPNLRAAWAHDIAAGDIESAWRWISALERFWDITGQRQEAYEWIQRALRIGEPPATRAGTNGLASTSPAEAVHWAHASIRHFRKVGDLMNAANSLFIVAQRSIYAGIADAEVHQRLTESS